MILRVLSSFSAFVMAIVPLAAQPTVENDLMNAFEQRKKMAAYSILKEYPVRNIGPTVQGARITDIEVNETNTREFYVAFASGGIFKTVNNGITFDPVFDNIDALGIGDFAISQTDPNVLYVGTGEKNSSRSSYFGSGLYKTSDGGTTWTHLGLAGTHHISRIIIHPEDNNVVWVAAIGSLYSNNEHRGVYKSSDGGKTWKKTLYVNDSTGVIDLVINPSNPRQLWAASWERTRKAWHFKGNGPGSAIYRSEDGGETWQLSISGFPEGDVTGRIGLAVCASKPNVVYAVLDNQGEINDKRKRNGNGSKLEFADFKGMSKSELLKLDDSVLNEFLREKGFSSRYTPDVVKREVSEGKYSTREIADYYGGFNPIDTKVIGAEVYRSDDGGATWKKMNTYDLDGTFYSYGYYFGEIRVSPDNPDLVYLLGIPLLKSVDAGITWHQLDTLKGIRNVHIDHHAMWINPKDPKHILLGNDGGLYQSYDEGATWLHINNMSVGQFYTVNVDMETPYNVYGGLQDNGVLKGSSKSVPNESPHWHSLFWGDGMFVAPDPRNSKIVYTGYQFGNYFRLETDKGKRKRITPQHDIGEQPLRWNWRTPLIMSKHNPDILYIAANKVYRSMDQGETWKAISPDLTKRLPYGNVPFSTISALAESPLKFGTLYVGTDDGNVMVSKNGGDSWTPINNGLPKNKWVSSIFPSPVDEATVFISLNGYRDDDFSTYLFASIDYGKTWKSVKGNLPESVANVIIQDAVNHDLLYCGLDNGTYISLDKGSTWHLFNGMLNVSSYDMLVHPRENELVVATHGRSVFVTDVKPLQALRGGGLNKGVMAFSSDVVQYDEHWGEKRFPWSKPLTPLTEILYYVGKPVSSVTVEVYNEKNVLVRKLSADGSLGFHIFTWDLKVADLPAQQETNSRKRKKPVTELPTVLKYAAKGRYKLKFINGSEISETDITLK